MQPDLFMLQRHQTHHLVSPPTATVLYSSILPPHIFLIATSLFFTLPHFLPTARPRPPHPPFQCDVSAILCLPCISFPRCSNDEMTKQCSHIKKLFSLFSTSQILVHTYQLACFICTPNKLNNMFFLFILFTNKILQ